MVKTREAFTIVELIIIVIVVAILVAIVTVGYSAVTNNAKEVVLKSDLEGAVSQLTLIKKNEGSYPANTSGISKTNSTVFAYSHTADTFCLEASTASLPGKVFYITQELKIESGNCPVLMAEDGSHMQTIASANCPTATRIRAVDARDNHTYWVQKLADGKCWMLTNLAYAGGGTNTYGDVKSLSNGPTFSEPTYTIARYYIQASGSNVTTEPTAPSTSTTGAGQYGYLYNWCAAMGGQATAACANTTTPAPNQSVSICPAGWRLPTGNHTTGEFTLLNNAINGGSTSTDAGLRSNWLFQYGGLWYYGFEIGGINGEYWSSSQISASSAYSLIFTAVGGGPSPDEKTWGFSVRCLAN